MGKIELKVFVFLLAHART